MKLKVTVDIYIYWKKKFYFILCKGSDGIGRHE